MNLQKPISTRNGQRRLISIQLEKFNNESSQSEKTALLEIMEAEITKNLNEKIVNHPDVDDLETDLEDITNSRDTSRSRVIRDSQDFNGSARTVSGANVSHSSRSINRVQSDNSSFHKLPKLSLPTFDGNVAQWQSFWDSYEAAVHFNQTLPDVQKFTYLRSLLQDTASTAVEGFPLTNANYHNAIDLLQERFRQSRNSVASLRRFHDKMKNYIQGLESLGECQNSYGDLLVPIIMNELLAKLRRNLAREHENARWQLQDLRAAIAREINILEVGQTDDNREPHVPMVSVFTGTGKKKYISKNHPRTTNSDNNKSKKLCLFCGDQHTSLNYEKVKTLKERLTIVKSKRLCYNCLGKRQHSDCHSKFRCRNCQRKHYSSICDQPSSVPGLNQSASPFLSSTSGPKGTPGAAIQLHSTTYQRSKFLLKTAVAQISSQDDAKTATNILLEEGAQRSFITEELAEKLKLKHTAPPNVTVLERFWKLESMGISEDEAETSTSGILNTYKENCITYKDVLERFWKLESMGISEDEAEKSTSGILNTYKENCITYKDGRYVAKLS
ncbi:uncharacterized protein LOC128554522 [Mercenaria mercenaria]|uniref:uncharacterized protein LOC128554522 n=1 Tax=Mercenaria mercenaria TaxID=6596 RepID=UPI00234EE3D5|nr:uncharacterized protein LOC128554522 [Mercenaria mercenaria]